MAIAVDWSTGVITIPQSDLTFVSGTLYVLDTEAFRRELIDLMDEAVGMPFLDPINHNTTVSIAGVTYARAIEIINGYTITFEDGMYAVRLDGSNNNLFDEGILNRNQVSVIPTNSAGLIQLSATAPDEVYLSVAYDESGTTISMGVWLERNATVILTPTSATVNWYNPDGSLLFSVTDSGPDALGHFELEANQALATDTAYYATVTVTDVDGTVATRRGVPTAS